MRWSHAVWILPACLLCCGLACDDDDGARPCTGNVGLVHGYVRIAGEAPARATFVWIESTDGGGLPHTETRTTVDSTGWYELRVPVGDYVLDLYGYPYGWRYARAGMVHRIGGRADTLSVSPRPLRIDMELGAATIDLLAPASLDTTQFVALEFVPDDPEVGRNIRDSVWPSGGRVLFEARPLAPGTYRLRVEVADLAYWLPGTLDPDQAARITVAADARATYTGALVAPWHLSGQVLGAWRALGLDPPDVRAFGPDSTLLAGASAGASGVYHLTIPLPIPARIAVDDWCWVGGEDFGHAAVFAGAPGESVTVPPLVRSGLECHIEPPDPLLDLRAVATLVDAQGRSAIPPGFRAPNSNPLVFPCLPPGTYYLKLSPLGRSQRWCPQWYGRTDDFAQAMPIVIPTEGAVAQIRMLLSGCGTITGRVLQPGGAPAGGRSVELFPADDPPQGTERAGIAAVTDAETGEFALRFVNDGAYRLGVRRTFTTLVWYPGTLAWDEAATVTLEDFGEVLGLEWTLVE